ncbi:MAG: hypothetical protein KAQ75_03130 [Bacteroidales bacterium]|nr:hypothetical protein [Bacteroidales bacterium]
MDFNDIKNAWKNSFKNEKLLNKEEIEAKLKIRGKSNTALNKVKRNFKFELILGGILSVFFISWIFINLEAEYKLIIIVLTVLFFGTLFSFTWRNFRKIRKTIISTEQLKPALIKTIKDIERYVNFNKSNFTKFILLPFAVCFGMSIGLFIGAGDQGISEIFSILESRIVKIILTLVIVCAVFIPISQYFNKKMYKQHLDELKQCLKDFEEIEE